MKTEWTPKPIDNERPLTLLDALEQIVLQAEDSALCPAFYEAARRPIAYIAERMQLTPQQAVLFAEMVALSDDDEIAPKRIAWKTGCSTIEALRFSNEFDALVSRRLLLESNRRGKKYAVSPRVLDALVRNEVYTPPSLSNLTCEELFLKLQKLATARDRGNIGFSCFSQEVTALLDANPQLKFIKLLNKVALTNLDLMLFVWCCNQHVSEEMTTITAYDISNLYDDDDDVFMQKMSLRKPENPLFKAGLLQTKKQGGTAQRDVYELTDYVRNEMLSELALQQEPAASKNVRKYDSIVRKELFYNPAEQQQIAQLTSLLQPEQFKAICNRLEQRGFRRGFACLFYGAPGTGKTETALQLARMTQRDIMQVNVEEIKSMWVGESEKNIKKLFDKYRELVRISDRAPILLFNEADAILNKRTEHTERAVDKMENSIQNIILQEIEQLEGILIATTNLQQNMDAAFERRFIYKIEFSKPTSEAKQAIWRSMIPELSSEESALLASRYDFSGGQIENIARKYMVDNLLLGANTSMQSLHSHCATELLHKSQARRPIGY